jgi:hypothetical protein
MHARKLKWADFAVIVFLSTLIAVGAGVLKHAPPPDLSGQQASGASPQMPTVRRCLGGARLCAGNEPFIALGFNYGCGTQLESTLRSFRRGGDPFRSQFRREVGAARQLGANTLRVYLELFAFLHQRGGKTVVAHRAVDTLRWTLREAEPQGIYLDLTGNLVWRGSRQWYDRLTARQRWRLQSRFWRAVARVGADSPVVLLYELTSEPAVPAHDPGTWYGGEYGDFRFGQYIVRNLGNRDPHQVARRWIARLSRAIRSRDERHLIGVGLPPFTGGPFGPANVSGLLDVLPVHVYPRANEADASVDLVREFTNHGRPVIIGETMGLSCDPSDQNTFLLGCHRLGTVDGYLGFFDGRRPCDVEGSSEYDLRYRWNLELFRDLGPLLLR